MNSTAGLHHIYWADVDCTDDYWSDDCTVEYCDRLAHGEKQASFVMSIPFFISAVLGPFLGFLVDEYGMRALVTTASCVLLVAVHLSLAWSKLNPIFPLVGQGLAYTAAASCIWPSIPLVVENRITGKLTRPFFIQM